MSVVKDILRYFGFSDDTRVTISAPGIDVVITGKPEKVSYLLEVVKGEMEKSSKRRRHGKPADPVQPTELDEMDSPYVLPEARAKERDRADKEDASSSPDRPKPPRPRPHPMRAAPSPRPVIQPSRSAHDGPVITSASRGVEEQPTLLPEEHTPEGEATALQPNPSGPARVPSVVGARPPTSNPRSPSIAPRAVPQAEIATMEVSPTRGRTQGRPVGAYSSNAPGGPQPRTDDLGLSEFAEVSDSDIQKI